MTARTYLFVPGDRPDRFDKAAASGSDAVVLDLEDAVAPASKDAARASVARWLQGASEEQRARSVVRINDAASPAFADDLRMLAAIGAVRAMLPKAETPAQVASLRDAAPSCGVLALIESARGVAQASVIAATPGVQRLVFGTLDLALDLDIEPQPEGLQHAAGCIVIASRAAGLPAPVAGVTPEIHDRDRLLVDLNWARRLGFGAKLCIHPNQVSPIHEALRPSPDAVAWARRVVAAAAASTGAAVQVDGHMVDAPVLRRAQTLIARAAGHPGR